MKKNKKKFVFTAGAITLGCLCCFNYNKPNLDTNNLIDNVIGVYLQNEDGTYTESTNIPTSGYKLNSSKSRCNNGVTPSWSNSELKLSSLKNGTSCYLYFDTLEETTMTDILASKTKSTRTDFSTTLTEDTTGTVFTAEDDDGTTYYYAGDVKDNWVKFAGYYWRIIRVNGDGSIRMIYNGPTTSQTGESTTIGTSAFNEKYDDNAYVGFMYTLNEVHGLGTSSTIKKELDKWYVNNLANYENYIDENAGFCGDRTAYIDNSGTTEGGGTGTTTTYYGGYIRLINSKSPSLRCANSSDLYTKIGTSKGNKTLLNSVGLITADEVVYAGGMYNTNNENYYLYINQFYWTISPALFSENEKSNFFRVNSNGNFSDRDVNNLFGTRPVINLKSDTIFESAKLNKGTAENPYIVKGAE